MAASKQAVPTHWRRALLALLLLLAVGQFVGAQIHHSVTLTDHDGCTLCQAGSVVSLTPPEPLTLGLDASSWIVSSAPDQAPAARRRTLRAGRAPPVLI